MFTSPLFYSRRLGIIEISESIYKKTDLEIYKKLLANLAIIELGINTYSNSLFIIAWCDEFEPIDPNLDIQPYIARFTLNLETKIMSVGFDKAGWTSTNKITMLSINSSYIPEALRSRIGRVCLPLSWFSTFTGLKKLRDLNRVFTPFYARPHLHSEVIEYLGHSEFFFQRNEGEVTQSYSAYCKASKSSGTYLYTFKKEEN